VAGCRAYVNESSEFLQDGDFLNQLSDYQFLSVSAPFSQVNSYILVYFFLGRIVSTNGTLS
jgi:hypothetical protein